MTRLAAAALLLAILSGSMQRVVAADVEVLTLGGEHKPIRVDTESLAWLSGQWLGTALGGEIEEVWMQPAAGTMSGAFRLIKDGRVVFYELMTLGESTGYTSMRLKHFHANLEGWEEAAKVVEFPLLKVEDGRFYFDGMTFVRGEKALEIHLHIDDRKQATRRVEVFRYRRSAAAMERT